MSTPGLTDPTPPKNRTEALLVLILFAQVFVFLAVAYESPVLPGDWSTVWMPLQLGMEIDILLMLATFVSNIGLIMGRGIRVGAKSRSVVGFVPGTLGHFLFTFFIGGGAAWAVLSLLVRLDPSVAGSSTTGEDAARLAAIVNIVLFVAVTEEFAFRAVLPLYTTRPWARWLIASGGFAVFHTSTYALEISKIPGNNGVVSPLQLGEALSSAFFAGLVLYAIYTRFGFGMAVGVHAGYDLVINSVIGSIHITPVALSALAPLLAALGH